MALKLTPDSFCSLIRQSGLIEQEGLKRLMQEFRAENRNLDSAREIADALVDKGALTRWQADKLLQGKHKGFFLGKYRLLRLLGKGGMSSVYLAEHVLMRRRCAIKVLPTKRVGDSSYLGRFHREAQAVASLDHPNIVRAYDVDQEGDIHFLVMEFVEGESLQDLVSRKGVVGFVEAADYLRQAADGLTHAHQAGMVHRDIKPGNLLLDKQETIKILDLGLARFFDEKDGQKEASLTVAHDEKVLGTADYLAPEQALDSHGVDARADLYSLGCTFYFLVTGHPPFTEGTLAQRLMSHQSKEPPPIENDRPDAPPDLLAIIRKTMAKAKDDRYQTAQSLSDDLAGWLLENGGNEWRLRHPGLSGSGSGSGAQVPVSSGQTGQPADSSPSHATGSPASASQTAESPQVPTAAPVAEQPPEAESEEASSAPSSDDDASLANFLNTLGSSQQGASGNSDAASSDSATAASPNEQSTPAEEKPAEGPAEQPPVAEPAAKQPDPPNSAPQTPPEMPVAEPVGSPVSQESQVSKGENAAVPVASPVESAVESPFSPADDSEPAASPRRRSGRRSRGEKSAGWVGAMLKPLIPKNAKTIPAIVAGLLTALIGFGLYTLFLGDSGNSGSGVTTGQGGAANQAPSELTETVTVGPDGDFANITDALEFVKTNYDPFELERDKQIIEVAGGQTYEERLVIDNSNFDYAAGIQLVCRDDEPAVLSPTDDKPVVVLKKVQGLTLEGFTIDAEGRPTAVQLAKFGAGSRLSRLTIRGFGETGISGVEPVPSFGANFDDPESDVFAIEQVDLHAGSPEAVGMRFQRVDVLMSYFLEVRSCRFLGPMAAGIVFEDGVKEVSIRENIFHETDEGIRLAGGSPHVSGFRLDNNTFYGLNRGLVFAHQPQEQGSGGLTVRHNLFANLSGPEAFVKKGYQPQLFQSLQEKGSGIQHNWTTRTPPKQPGKGELRLLFQKSGKEGLKNFSFASTDPQAAGFLAPASKSPNPTIGKSSDTLKPYVGAVAPDGS